MGICLEDTHALDDDLPDTFEDWITEQDVDDIIAWANVYGENKVLEGLNRAIKIINLEKEKK